MIFFKKKDAASGTPSPLTIAVAIVILVAAVGLRVKSYVDTRQPTGATVTVEGRVIPVEVADTPEKRSLGLGQRDALAEDSGMYFPMGATQYWTFWMKGMRFPIDIVWIREGRIVDISADVQVSDDVVPPLISPVEPADAVLELNAGKAAEWSLKPGTEVRLDAETGR
jgi:uncharacterized membrane protein (UPF0127 family)